MVQAEDDGQADDRGDTGPAMAIDQIGVVSAVGGEQPPAEGGAGAGDGSEPEEGAVGGGEVFPGGAEGGQFEGGDGEEDADWQVDQHRVKATDELSEVEGAGRHGPVEVGGVIAGLRIEIKGEELGGARGDGERSGEG